MQVAKWPYRMAFGAGIFILWGTDPLLAQVAPPMGDAGTFAVLGGSGVTNTGGTAVTGDVGVAPGIAITGFPPGTVIDGGLHSNDAVAQAAQGDLATAYGVLVSQACNTDLSGTDLGGLTLSPAVYCFASSAGLTGTLTLDAQGDPDAVFVFQIASTLTTATAAAVVLVNGGSDCNVFWQVGSSMTLGGATQFIGNTLALTSITLVTGSSSHGALLASNGAVTLDTNQVAVCVPTVPVTLQSFDVG